MQNFATSLKFDPPTFENAARHLNYETKVQCCDDRPMSSPSLVKLGPCIPVGCAPLRKTAARKHALLSITQLWIIRFYSYLVQSLNA